MFSTGIFSLRMSWQDDYCQLTSSAGVQQLLQPQPGGGATRGVGRQGAVPGERAAPGISPTHGFAPLLGTGTIDPAPA